MPTVIKDRSNSKTDADIEDRILAIAKKLAAENHGRQTLQDNLTINSDITKDLGLDSLARVELFSRINEQLNITLDEELFTKAVTLQDLLQGIIKKSNKEIFTERARIKTKPEPSQYPQLELPISAATLCDVLYWYAQRAPHREHIQLYDDKAPGETISYQQLLSDAKKVASGLQSLHLEPQRPVAIMLPTGKEYFFSFFGILLAGAIPVPLYPPARLTQLEDHIRRHVNILNNCAATILITVPEAKNIARLLKTQVSTIKHIVTVNELFIERNTFKPYSYKPEDVAFIQYTSGSTGTPKGVALTHKNLLANIRAMGEATNASNHDVFVSWLPLYHDMGLIGAWLGSCYFAARLVVMSPLAFLTKPERWLWAIHRYGGTLSASPNFGYEFCLRRIKDKDIENLDLSTWRGAYNGAETVSPDTVEKFCQRFEQYGFNRKSYAPVYGLAENSVGLAFPPPNRGPIIDIVQRDAFMQTGQAIPADKADATAIKFVGCGQALKGHQIRIVDKSNKELPNRQEGRLQFKGPSATSGYYKNPEKTKELIHDGWLDSGDLAYIANREIYLTGRTKDIIIRGGRNIYPHELEEVVGNIEGIRTGRVAAFGSRDAQSATERLVVLAETRETEQEKLTKLENEINSRINDLVGLPPDEVVLAPPGTVLKTSSGKIRRAASKSLYENGETQKGPQALWLQIARLLLSGLALKTRRFYKQVVTVIYGLYAQCAFWIIAPVAWSLVAVLPLLSWRWTVMRWSTRVLAFCIGIPLSITGRENLLPENTPCIYVCNHASYLDGPYVIALLNRQFSFIAKVELSHQFIPRIFLNRIHAKYVERFDVQKSISDAEFLASQVESGKSLFFFPEGTFQREEGLLPFHMGAFVTAAQAQVPVIPITLNGSREIVRQGNWLPRHGAVSVTVGNAIDPHDFKYQKDAWAKAVWLRDQARLQILHELREPDLNTN